MKVGRFRLSDYFSVAILGVWYKFVNFGGDIGRATYDTWAISGACIPPPCLRRIHLCIAQLQA